MNKHGSADLLDLEGAWEVEPDINLPKNEANIFVTQQTIQHQITLHKLVDKSSNWGDIRIFLPQTRYRKITNKSTKSATSNNKIANFDYQLFNAFYAKKIFYFVFNMLGVILKIALFLLLTLLGEKKALRKMRFKSQAIRNKKPRRNKNVKKVFIQKLNEPIVYSQAGAKREQKSVNTNFVPTSNLYCNSCTKKLGLQSCESGGRYYCEVCHSLKNKYF